MMKKILAAVTAAAMMAGILAGCGSSSASSATSAGGSSGSSGGTAITADGTVTIGIPKVTESFDFYNTTNGYESYSMSQVYDSLVKKNADGEIEGSLAESYDVSEDGKTYTFNLHQGVKFSDGSELKASDVVYSMDQAIKSAYTSWIYEPLVDDCKALDDYTVEIDLKKGSISFLDYLSNAMYFAVLSENAVTKANGSYGTSADSIVGTGPYVVTDWKPGESVTYKANDDYFQGAPSIKNVEFRAFADSNTAVIALQTGEIAAYFDDVPGVSYDTLSKTNNLKVVDYASTIYFETIMNCESGVFADKDVRKAVAMAVDRQNMLVVGTEGYGSICDYPGNRSGHTEGDPERKDVWYPTDVDAAKKIIEDKGLAGTSVEIKTYADDPYPALATVLQNALSSIGFNATVLQMERSAFIDEVLGKGDYDIGICRWAAGTTDMDEIWYGSLDTDSIGPSGNWSFYSNSELDSILEKAGGDTDAEERKELYSQAIDIFVEDVPQIPLYYPNGSRAYNTGLSIEDGLVEYNRIYDYKIAG